MRGYGNTIAIKRNPIRLFVRSLLNLARVRKHLIEHPMRPLIAALAPPKSSRGYGNAIKYKETNNGSFVRTLHILARERKLMFVNHHVLPLVLDPLNLRKGTETIVYLLQSNKHYVRIPQILARVRKQIKIHTCLHVSLVG